MTYSHVDAGHTAAAYEVTLDIDSSLPDWLVALATRAVPIYTLLAVTEQVERTRQDLKINIARLKNSPVTKWSAVPW